MDLSELIRHYGYGALVIGTFFEGESVMILAGCAVHTGMLNFGGVVLAGALGVFCSDQFCFHLGRFCGPWVLRRFPSVSSHLNRTFDMLFRHPHWFIIGFQFVLGTSTVTPIALGMSKVSAVRFLLLDLIGIFLWTSAYACGGYLFGAVLVYFIHDFSRYGFWALLVLLLGLFATRWCRACSGKRTPPPARKDS